MISAKNLRKSFVTRKNEKIVFKNLNFNLSSGETTSFLGPSGCGKSTLLRMIAGLEKPTEGSLTIEAKTSGFVFQEPRLLPWKTVLENVLIPIDLAAQNLSKDAVERAQTNLRKMHLKNLNESYPHELSGGMKMRVSVARSLVHSPQLLLFDEPFSALDEQTREALQREILELTRSEKLTAIFVTHSISEAATLSDRIIIFDRDGNIVIDERHPIPNAKKTEDYFTSDKHFSFIKKLSLQFHEHNEVET